MLGIKKTKTHSLLTIAASNMWANTYFVLVCRSQNRRWHAADPWNTLGCFPYSYCFRLDRGLVRRSLLSLCSKTAPWLHHYNCLCSYAVGSLPMHRAHVDYLHRCFAVSNTHGVPEQPARFEHEKVCRLEQPAPQPRTHPVRTSGNVTYHSYRERTVRRLYLRRQLVQSLKNKHRGLTLYHRTLTSPVS